MVILGPTNVSEESWSAHAMHVDEVHDQMFSLFLAQAIVAVVTFVGVLVLFPSAPVLAPSRSAYLKRTAPPNARAEKCDFSSYRALLKNRPFLFLMVSYGIVIGSSMAFVTMISQILTPFHQELPQSRVNQMVAQMSFSRTLAGFCGSLLAGGLLDRYRRYKTELENAEIWKQKQLLQISK